MVIFPLWYMWYFHCPVGESQVCNFCVLCLSDLTITIPTKYFPQTEPATVYLYLSVQTHLKYHLLNSAEPIKILRKKKLLKSHKNSLGHIIGLSSSSLISLWLIWPKETDQFGFALIGIVAPFNSIKEQQFDGGSGASSKKSHSFMSWWSPGQKTTNKEEEAPYGLVSANSNW